MPGPLYGAIEAGGTKFICALAQGPDEILAETRIATTTPAATLAEVVEFFAGAQARVGAVRAFGIGAFGPIELDPRSAGWGRLLPNPKPHWSDADLAGPLRARFGVPIALDTDVNAAALGEFRLGAGRGLRSLAYVTVGTGIGGGAIVDGRPLHGRLHPEMGHIRVRRDPRDHDFAGDCPFHGDCVEGLANGASIRARWGRPLNELAADHEAWPIIGGYLGQLAATIALMLSPERIVFGGGVMTELRMFAHVRAAAVAMLNGYLPAPLFGASLEGYIVPPGLGTRSGLCGAVLLAEGASTRIAT
jgi:fructokinase